jgi:hypothetical protein
VRSPTARSTVVTDWCARIRGFTGVPLAACIAIRPCAVASTCGTMIFYIYIIRLPRVTTGALPQRLKKGSALTSPGDSDTARRGPAARGPAAAPPRCHSHIPHLRTGTNRTPSCTAVKFRIRFLVVSTEYGRLNCPLHESTSSTRMSTHVPFGLQLQFAPRPTILLLRLQLRSILRRPTPHRLEPKNRAKAAQRPPRRKFN